MTQTRTKEQVLQAYKKGNQNYRATLLKKYGAKDFNRLSTLLDTTTSRKEVQVTKAELSNIVKNNLNVEMTVSFNKTVKTDVVLEQLMDVYNFTPPYKVKDSFKKCLDKGLKGEIRIAEGFHTGKTDAQGRLYFTETTVERDLSRNSDNRTILVTLQNLNWVEIGLVKYFHKD